MMQSTEPAVAKPTILAIDIGTTSVRAANISPELNILALASRPVALHRPKKDHAEQNGDELLTATQHVIQAIFKGSKVAPSAAALAIQRSTVIAWHAATGRAVTPALSWQDVRTKAKVAALHKHRKTVKQTSGLVLSPHYGASKLAWLKQRVVQTDARVAPLVSFILYNLLENSPYVCDESNACRTQLYDIRQRCWSPELAQLFQVPVKDLPKAVPTRYSYGTLKNRACPLIHVCGDQSAAYAALHQADASIAVANFGTGGFLMARGTPETATPLLESIIDSDTQRTHAVLEGTINGAGAALDWFWQQWCNNEPLAPSRSGYNQLLTQALGDETVPPVFVNTVGGLGSPWWGTHQEPHFISTKNVENSWRARAKAVLESIAFLAYANLHALKTCSMQLTQLNCAGGLTQISGFPQMLANALEIPVAVSQHSEATLLGLAILCGNKNTLQFRLHHPQPETALLERRNTLLNIIDNRICSQENTC